MPLRRIESVSPARPRDGRSRDAREGSRPTAPTAAALAADLEAVRDGRPVSVRPLSATRPLVRWAKRQPAKAALLVAVIAGVPLVAALGGFILANLPKIEKADAAHDARKLGELLEDGFLEHGEGDPAVAQGLFEAALRLDPRSAEANAGFALARLEQKDPASALAFLTGPAGSYASANWSLQIQVEALRRLGKTDESTALGRTLPPLGPAIDHFVAGMLAMAKFHRIGRRDIATRAFDHLRRAVQSAPTASRLYHYEFGHAAWHALKKEEAREIAVEIQNLWPPSPEQWLAIGRTLLNADHKAAIDALEQAARTPPRSLVGREFLVRYLGESQKPSAMESAIELGRKIVAAHPSRAISHVLLGGAFLNQGDLDAALETLSAAKKLEPTDAAVHLAFAQLFMLKKEFREAEVAARESLRTAPDKIVTLQVLGAALFALDEFEEGVKPLEASLALSPDDAANLCNLGRGLCRIGEFKKGLEHLKKGHELGSASPGWSYPSKRWVVNAERKVVLESTARGSSAWERRSTHRRRAGGSRHGGVQPEATLRRSRRDVLRGFQDRAVVHGATVARLPARRGHGRDPRRPGQRRRRAARARRADEAPRSRPRVDRRRVLVFAGHRGGSRARTRIKHDAIEGLDRSAGACGHAVARRSRRRGGRGRELERSLESDRRRGLPAGASHPRGRASRQPMRSDQSASFLASSRRARTRRVFATPRVSPSASAAVAMSFSAK